VLRYTDYWTTSRAVFVNVKSPNLESLKEFAQRIVDIFDDKIGLRKN